MNPTNEKHFSPTEFEMTSRRKELETIDDQLATNVRQLKGQVISNRDATAEGNKMLPELQNQGESLQEKLAQATNRVNNILAETNDWTVIYVLIIEFVLFILFLFF